MSASCSISGREGVPLCRVMEDNAHCVTQPRADAADAVAKVYAIVALGALHRTIVDSKSDCIALAQWHDLRPALYTRSLLRQHKFTTREILPRLREEDRHLKRKGEIAVKILMQAIEVAGKARRRRFSI
jgi:hypothetical protein